MLDNLNVKIYQSIVRSAPPETRLKMLRELSRVIGNQNNTERIIRRRILMGPPRRSVIGRKMAKIRVKVQKRKLSRKGQVSPSNIFSRLRI
jgi:hypothetical protein